MNPEVCVSSYNIPADLELLAKAIQACLAEDWGHDIYPVGGGTVLLVSYRWRNDDDEQVH